MIGQGDGPEPPVIAVNVPFTGLPPRLDGQISFGEWTVDPQIQLERGEITVIHDRMRLYFLINMREDRTDNSVSNSGADQLWMLFDWDRNGQVTQNLDRRYRILGETGNFRYETYAEPGGFFPFNDPVESTFSALAEGFGCFFGDGSATVFPVLSCDAHRMWEVAIDLREIRAERGNEARLGLLVQSDLNFFEALPANLDDMASFIQLALLGSTDNRVPSGETTLDRLEFRVSQAIQDSTNSLILVEDRATWLDLFVENEVSVGAIVNMFVSRNGVDMPGSPLAVEPILRLNTASGLQSARMIVPLADDWALDGVEVRVAARQPAIGSITVSHTQTVSFTASETPTYWIVPFNTGTASTPIRASENYIRRNELETIATFPVPDINFVRRPELTDNPATMTDAIDRLNEYDHQAVLAWTLGLIFTGESPFELPDQVVGVFPRSQYGRIGLSDPLWVSGAGRVSWVQETNSFQPNLNIPHEINHNLDLDPDGTWGRHVPLACTTRGPDPLWPYANDDIQDAGLVGTQVLDWSNRLLSPPLAVAGTTPDYMSYCTTNAQPYPSQWTSPYRWNRQLQNVFASAPLTQSLRSSAVNESAVQAGLYITGTANEDGSGMLDPVLRQHGVIRMDHTPGDYELRLLACDGSTQFSKPFSLSFVDVEGNPRTTAAFAMILPDPGEFCTVQLLGDQELLAERVVSEYAPEVTVSQPNGGESWSTDQELVAWSATDDDEGDTLTASILYSADGGATWMPVASSIEGTEFTVDSRTLPGTQDGRIRVIVTDGINTSHDDSDGPFTVADKPPAVAILSPPNNAIVPAGSPVTFHGVARTPRGNRLGTDSFIWSVDGAGMGLGNPVSAMFAPGQHQVVLQATAGNELTGEAAIQLMVLPAGTPTDPVGDVALSGLDLIAVQAGVAGGRFECKLLIASGSSGLPDKGQFKCRIDFDDEEMESATGCDADGDGALDGGYRLGSNGMCSVVDVGLTYRVGKKGGSCNGLGDVACTIVETDEQGNSDAVCDGEVGERHAQYCHIVISTDLDSLVAARAAECDSGNACPTTEGGYPINLYVTSHLKGDRDRLPQTSNSEEPSMVEEVVRVLLPL